MSKGERIRMARQQQQQQQQIQVDPSDVTIRKCAGCNGELFEQALKVGIMSGLNPKNPTGKDFQINIPVVVCKVCGWEFGKPVIEDGTADGRDGYEA